jgi:hypothetical protein
MPFATGLTAFKSFSSRSGKPRFARRWSGRVAGQPQRDDIPIAAVNRATRGETLLRAKG